VEVVEANQAQSSGAAIGIEFAMAVSSGPTAVNMNTVTPLARDVGGGAGWGNSVDVGVAGSSPGVTYTVPTTNATTSININTSAAAVYVFAQQITDTVNLSAALTSTYNLVAQTNTNSLINTIQCGGAAAPIIGLHVWSQGGLLPNGVRQLGYASSGAVTFTWASTANSTKRSWLFKMPSFQTIKPRTGADDVERRVLDKINRMMMSSSWVGPTLNPHDNTVPAPIHDEKGAQVSFEQLNEIARYAQTRVITPASIPKDGWVKIPTDPVVVPTKRTPTPNRSGGGPSGS